LDISSSRNDAMNLPPQTPWSIVLGILFAGMLAVCGVGVKPGTGFLLVEIIFAFLFLNGLIRLLFPK
jgi:hypothetical protein